MVDVIRKPAGGWQRPYTVYILSLVASVALWLLAVHAPLWLDETGSYWQIIGGFSQLWARQGLTSVAYPAILWFASKILGTSVVALRLPSVLAMLAAVWLLYRAAREIFDAELAFIAAIVFSVNPIVVFAAVDVRPYAFGALAINLSIWIVLRLRRSASLGLAALFGLSAALILYFQYLFAVILPALLLCFFAFSGQDYRIRWKQFAAATAAFLLACLPLISPIMNLFRTSGSHNFDVAPQMVDLIWTLAPGWVPVAFCITAAAAVAMAARSKATQDVHFSTRLALVCAALTFIPLLSLYTVSVATPLHIFVERHRLIAVPGIALGWALLLSPFRSRWLRLLFCASLVSLTAIQAFSSPTSTQHGYTWKYALQAAEQNASVDNAPVLICSDFPESDFIAMPLHSAKSSRYFAPLSYYRLTVPVVPLPRSLNAQAEQIGSQFLATAASKHERFLALGFWPSRKILDWLSHQAALAYTVRTIGIYDQIKVLEFDPRRTSAP